MAKSKEMRKEEYVAKIESEMQEHEAYDNPEWVFSNHLAIYVQFPVKNGLFSVKKKNNSPPLWQKKQSNRKWQLITFELRFF